MLPNGYPHPLRLKQIMPRRHRIKFLLWSSVCAVRCYKSSALVTNCFRFDESPGGRTGCNPRMYRHERVMRVAHEEGMNTSCTMLIGHIEFVRERIEHLSALRDMQDYAKALPISYCQLPIEMRRIPSFASFNRQLAIGNRQCLALPKTSVPRQRLSVFPTLLDTKNQSGNNLPCPFNPRPSLVAVLEP